MGVARKHLRRAERVFWALKRGIYLSGSPIGPGMVGAQQRLNEARMAQRMPAPQPESRQVMRADLRRWHKERAARMKAQELKERTDAYKARKKAAQNGA